MIIRKRSLIPIILVILTLVLTPIPALAMTLIGNFFPITNTSDLREEQPSIAFNSHRNHYLVVWTNNRPGNDDIRAQKIAVDGRLIDGPFYISAGLGHDRWKPDIVYNSVSDQYLVVWEDYDNASMVPGNSIRARLISSTGMFLGKDDIIIRALSPSFYKPSDPAVAYASVTNRYLVVWHEVTHVGTPTHIIHGQVVTPQGALEGLPIEIASSPQLMSPPDLAYSPRDNRYLVAWQQYNPQNTVYDIKGQRLTGNGDFYGPIGTYHNSGKACEGPAVAALPNDASDNTYMIAFIWQDSQVEGYGLAYVNQAGTLRNWVGWGTAPDSKNHIAIAANQSSETYLVGYQDDYGILDKYIVLVQQPVLSPQYIEKFEIPGLANDFPAITAGPTGDYLVVWQGQPLAAAKTDIYGAVFGIRTYLPMIRK